MKDKRKILLGTKDVVPQENKDLYLNLEIYSSPDELQTEIVNNNFNLKDQFNDERRRSLKFCVYGTLDCITADLDDVELEIQTNHEDLLYKPRIEANAKAGIVNIIKTKPLSHNNNLSKNIFKKNKSSFCFIFELAPGIKNYGETKVLKILINDRVKKIYARIDVPFLFFDDDGKLVDFGTDTVDIDLNGEEQIIENDFPFLYGTHWIKQEISLPRPLILSFRRSESSDINNLTVQEKSGTVKFVVSLDAPSIYGIEETEIFIKETSAINNPNKDYNFKNQKLSWAIGEQFKEVTIDIVDDLFTEDDESIVFGFKQPKYVMTQSNNNTFNLTIKNDDVPSVVSFEGGFAKIVSDEMGIKTYLQTDKPVKVPNQSVDIVLDNENSTIVIGEDIKNTGSEDNPEYRQNIPLKQGLDIFEIEIKIKDNLKYDLTKNAIFKLENGTQNIKPEEGSEFTLEIEDSMTTRYTNYIIDSDPKKGQGIFRLESPVPTNSSEAISFINTKQFTTAETEHTVTNLFSYTLEVINEGEPMIYGNELYNNGETILYVDSDDGYENFSFTLPSNTKLNEQNKYFEKSKYKFKITDIKPSLGASLAPFDPSALTNNTFADFEIESRKLNSSLDKSGTTHYLTSEMSGVMTRLKYIGPDKELTETYDLIVRAGINRVDGNTIIKNKLKNTREFDNANGGVNNNALNQAKSRVISYRDEYPNLTPPEGAFEILNKVYELILKADISETDNSSTIRQKLRETGEFSIPGGIDNSALVEMTSRVKKYIEKNPGLTPPGENLTKNYAVLPVVTTDKIDCKINGLLLLSKAYTETSESGNDFFGNSAFGGFGNNNNSSAAVKVTNVLFKEEPVEYTCFRKLSDGQIDRTLFNLMPVEPITD